ncbi:356_t:CDS:1, partial [Entrophospora sp. SA101]
NVFGEEVVVVDVVFGIGENDICGNIKVVGGVCGGVMEIAGVFLNVIDLGSDRERFFIDDDIWPSLSVLKTFFKGE